MEIMNLSSSLAGHWRGTYRLILNWLPDPDFISDSDLSVKSVANGKFLVLDYDWQHEGASQDGLLLIGNVNKAQELTASWVDSWGMSGKIMNCNGTISQDGYISLLGAYEVPDHPDWGWRTEIHCPTADTLKITMYNISPEGEESLAVDSSYTRVNRTNDELTPEK
ncbi:hypothetical protein C7T94_10810 [Pedobacter yulinensis]|uniref:DUF1579 domain-containing protein n=1 Tax=Pedobacter yulinensis TaxID=2126353 RepID=A0A2T3HKX9_9SPHI|nr:DUF1579 family protein [Pedobacter yulinensis]PST83097.1 hypothetical protein C7T94_10810 [Pedobacter yulinensis]